MNYGDLVAVSVCADPLDPHDALLEIGLFLRGSPNPGPHLCTGIRTLANP
jgi:hypothetical protein